MIAIAVPKRFIQDHGERDLPTPTIIEETARHYVIDDADPALPELINDAKYYADANGPDAAPAGLKTAALALLSAIARKAGA